MYFSRPLIPCICAYSLGLWLVHDVYHSQPVAAYITVAIMLMTMAAASFYYRTTTAVYLALVVLAGMAVMFTREADLNRASRLTETLSGSGILKVSGTVRITADIHGTERKRLTLVDVELTSNSTTYRMPGKVSMTVKDSHFDRREPPVAGERVVAFGKIYHPVALQNFYGYDRREALRHDEVYATFSPLDISGIMTVKTVSYNWKGRITQQLSEWRQSVSAAVRAAMWPREGRLMVAMLFNDMNGLTEEERIIFRDSQTFHLFAVSGMHVAILGMALNLVLRACRVGLRASWILVTIILFVYLWIIGFVPSATRSYLMLVAFTSGYMLRREVDSITSLAFAVAAVLAYDPACWWKPGFTLSVAGVASIVLLAPLFSLWVSGGDSSRDRGALASVKSGALNALLVTMAVTLGMLPMQLYYFGFWNALSPLANLLQTAVSSLVLSGGCITAGVGMISPSFAEIVGHSTSLLMALIFYISRWTAENRWAFWSVAALPAALMFISYAIMFSGYYLVWKDTPEFRQKSRARFAVHFSIGLGILLGFHFWETVGHRELEIWGFDVGQGDATLVRTPAGQTILLDAGIAEPDMGSLVVLPQLRGLGIDRLDYVIATHDDADHIGGLSSVLDQMDVGFLCVGPGVIDGAPSREMQKLLAQAKKRHVSIRQIGAGELARSGDCRIQILNPLPDGLEGKSDNDKSVVVKIDYGKFSALFTGDAGMAVEARLANSNVLTSATVLKVGHHGSRFSSSEGFIQTLQPRLALVSCGANNQFGHPHPDVVARLAKVGSAVYRTDKDGAIRVSTDGHQVTVSTSRDRRGHGFTLN